MLQHEETLTFLARQVEAVAWKGQMEARNLAMVVNAFSKLRRRERWARSTGRDEELMGAISFQLKSSARALNAVDLATVANGYARLWLHDAEPLIDALPSCSIQNLAMIAHAYGRFFRRDEPLLLALCRQLLERQRRCGEVIPAENMGSIVHAYATRLRFCPEEFLRVVEHSLPKVVMQMELPDTILTVAALKNMPKESFDFPRIRGPVFAQCLKFMPKLMSSGLVSVMAAAVHLEHENPQFWTQIFWQGAVRTNEPDDALAKTEMVRLQEALAESVLSGGFSEMPLETLSDWAKALSRLQGFEVLKAPVLSEATRRLGAGVVPAAARKGLVEALQQMHADSDDVSGLESEASPACSSMGLVKWMCSLGRRLLRPVRPQKRSAVSFMEQLHRAPQLRGRTSEGSGGMRRGRSSKLWKAALSFGVSLQEMICFDRKSAWSIPLVLSKHNFLESIFGAFLIIMNATMQVLFTVIIMSPDFLGEGLSVQDARTWRLRFAHDLDFVGLDQRNLASIVCDEDGALIFSTAQVAQLVDINNYLGLDKLSFELPNFQPGMLLAVLCILLWNICIFAELRSVWYVLRGVLLSAGASTSSLKGLSWQRISIMTLVCVGRAVVAGALLISGTIWLGNTTSITELMLNSVALEAVLHIDEFICRALVPTSLQQKIKRLPPMQVRRSRRWPSVENVLLACMLAAALLVPYMIVLAPLRATMLSVKREMCGGLVDFVITGTCVVRFAEEWAEPAARTGFLAFPESFVFGVATSAYQIEGAAAEGRGPSIWDTFSTAGHAKDGATGEVACDHYHFSLKVKAYRFSISWSRLLPNGDAAEPPSEEGLRFYSELLDALLQAGIEPWVTLYHWDLPEALHAKGGWLSKEMIVKAFGDYARSFGRGDPPWASGCGRICFHHFGDRVKYWITLNEPWCSAVLGYNTGDHAPGYTEETDTACYVAGHHLLLAHAEAAQIYREERSERTARGAGCSKEFAQQGGEVGISLNADWRQADSEREEDSFFSEEANSTLAHIVR
eukprot:g14869.t2